MDADTDALSHLFDTNVPPSPVEIAELEEGVDSMEPRILQLISELETLEQKFRLYLLALSPARRLPPEILHEILIFVDDHTLLRTSQVCRTWYRASATISYRYLSRTSIRFTKERGVPCNRIRSWLAKPVHGVKTLALKHVVRSDRICSCDHYIVTCPWSSLDFRAIFTDTPSSGQLALEFAFSTANCVLNLLRAVGDTPLWRSLNSLRLTFPAVWTGRLTKYREILYQLPKGLKKLTLEFKGLNRGPLRIPIRIPEAPFRSLLVLEIECGWDSPLILSILRLSLNLEELSLNFCTCQHTWANDASVARVTLPKVHTLHLDSVDPDGVGRTLRLLHLPSLSRLTVAGPSPLAYHYDKQALPNTMDALGLFSATQPVPLRSLVLKNASCDTVWTILPRLPLLESLVLDGVFPASKFIGPRDESAESGRAPWAELVPSLKSLEVRGLDEEFELDPFLKLLATYQTGGRCTWADDRLNGACGLRKVVLSYARWVGDSPYLDGIWDGCWMTLRSLKSDLGLTVRRARDS